MVWLYQFSNSLFPSESVTVKSGSGTALVKQFDIQTSDGVIHAIDTVIWKQLNTWNLPPWKFDIVIAIWRYYTSTSNHYIMAWVYILMHVNIIWDLRKRTSTVLHSLRKVRVQLINNNNFIQIGDCVFCGMAMPAWRILYWLNSLFHNWPIEKCLDNVENLLNLSQTSLSIGDCIFCRLANAMLTFRIPNIGLNFLFRAIPCPEVHKINTTTHFW